MLTISVGFQIIERCFQIFERCFQINEYQFQLVYASNQFDTDNQCIEQNFQFIKICVSARHGRQLHGIHGVQRHGRSGVSRLLKHSAALPRKQAGGRQRRLSVGRHTWSRRLMLPRPRRDLRPAATEIRTRHAQVATTMRSRPGRPCATLANADHVAGASTQPRSAPGISE